MGYVMHRGHSVAVLFAIASFGKKLVVLSATCHQLQRALCDDSVYAGTENASVEKILDHKTEIACWLYLDVRIYFCIAIKIIIKKPHSYTHVDRHFSFILKCILVDLMCAVWL